MATGLVVNAGKWSWRKLNPLTLTIGPYGGTEACLVVRPSLDGEFYGIGQLMNSSFGPQQPFDLDWEKGHNKRAIRAGDKDLIILSRVRQDYSYNPPVLAICGSAGNVWSISLSDEVMQSLGWIHFRTEIRSIQGSGTWVNEYRFRFSYVDFRFEILKGHPKTGQRRSPQNRPMKAARDQVVLPRLAVIGQACFGTPTPWATLENVAMMEEAVEHGSHGGTIP